MQASGVLSEANNSRLAKCNLVARRSTLLVQHTFAVFSLQGKVQEWSPCQSKRASTNLDQSHHYRE